MTTIATWNLHHMTRELKIPDGVPKVIEQVTKLVEADAKRIAYEEVVGAPAEEVEATAAD